MELTRDHFEALDEAALVMLHSLMRRYPQEARSLVCILAARSFTDMISSSPPSGVAALFDIVNAQLSEAGVQIVATRRH